MAMQESGDQPVSPEFRKQVEESIIGWLVAGKAETTGFGAQITAQCFDWTR
jgi:hypothetical protein